MLKLVLPRVQGTALSAHAVTRHWSGLTHWRRSDLDNRRSWTDGHSVETAAPADLPAHIQSLVSGGEAVLNTPDPVEKASLTNAVYSAFRCAVFE